MPLFLAAEPAPAMLANLIEALDQVETGIVLLDPRMCVRYINRRFGEICPGSDGLAAAPGLNFRMLVEHAACAAPADTASLPFVDRIEALVSAGNEEPCEIDLPDGRHLLLRCSPCPDGGRILLFNDITSVKAMQEQVREAYDLASRIRVEHQFNAETLESQAAYLASLAEAADESARNAAEANRQLEQEIAERRELEAQLQKLATTDSLTGILNRARFLALGQRTLEHARQLGRTIAVFMLDIDHFKAINDRYGHLVGDEAIRHVVAQLRAGLRDNDLLGRVGGEEFAIVLPRITRQSARRIAERLRRSVETAPLQRGADTIRITVSIGLAILHDGDQAMEQLLGRADARLYAAKAAGRNRVAAEDDAATDRHAYPELMLRS